MQDHLTADALERLVHRRCHVSLAYGWLLHLLGCEACRNRLVRDFLAEGEVFLREVFRTQQPVSMPELGDPETVDRILAHLKTDGISSFLETRPLPDYLDTLPDQPEARQAWAVRNSRRLRDPAVVEHLLARCQVLWKEDAERAARLARLAVRIGNHLPSEEIHPEILTTLRFEAWSKLGNSERILGRFPPSRRALGKARELWNDTAGSPALRIRHLHYEALYLRDHQYPELALNLARRAEALQDPDDEDMLNLVAGTTLTANSLVQLRRFGEARRRLETALERFSVDEVGPVFYAGMLNCLVRALGGEGLFLPAWSALRERDRLARGAGELDRLRLAWTGGLFNEHFGDLGAAEEHYRRVLQRTEDLSLAGDRAMILVDLTRVSMQRDHRRAARDFAGEAVPRLIRLRRPRLATEVERMVSGGPLVAPS